MKTSEKVWVFRFTIESENGNLVDQNIPEQLLETIIDWVEKRGYQIGGGFSPPNKCKNDDKPLFDLRE